MDKKIHKTGMPFGWVVVEGRTYPAFICAETGEAITKENPGTLYWREKTGEMLVLSDQAKGKKPRGGYTTEIDVLSHHLFMNTAGKNGTKSQKQTLKKVKFEQMVSEKGRIW